MRILHTVRLIDMGNSTAAKQSSANLGVTGICALLIYSLLDSAYYHIPALVCIILSGYAHVMQGSPAAWL